MGISLVSFVRPGFEAVLAWRRLLTFHIFAPGERIFASLFVILPMSMYVFVSVCVTLSLHLSFTVCPFLFSLPIFFHRAPSAHMISEDES